MLSCLIAGKVTDPYLSVSLSDVIRYLACVLSVAKMNHFLHVFFRYCELWSLPLKEENKCDLEDNYAMRYFMIYHNLTKLQFYQLF